MAPSPHHSPCNQWYSSRLLLCAHHSPCNQWYSSRLLLCAHQTLATSGTHLDYCSVLTRPLQPVPPTNRLASGQCDVSGHVTVSPPRHPAHHDPFYPLQLSQPVRGWEEEIDDRYVADEEIDDRYVADEEIDDRYVADEEIDDRYVADEEIDDRYVADDEIDERNVAGETLCPVARFVLIKKLFFRLSLACGSSQSL
ncbi:hypothetical protein Btru_001341 [Bulinus truncatus]|nr:hypothetical protein Btru_001341 [Bulinus truncatus]